MKPTANETRLLHAMNEFRDSYHKLLKAVDIYEVDANSSINDLAGFAESYPFDKSFDELAIDTWVDDITERCEGIKYAVLDYEYLNTGGNTMVGIHEVYLPAENKTVYVYTNEEGATISHVDYIRHDIPNADYDKFLLEWVDWGRITGHEKYFELYRHCYNEYLKDDCKYFGTTRNVQYHLLNDELQSKVNVDYLVWLEANSDGLIRTNGVDIIEDPDYATQFEDELDEKLQEIKDFKQWHDNLINNRTTDDELDELYDSQYTLTINGKSINLPFDADTFNNIDYVLKRVIAEW